MTHLFKANAKEIYLVTRSSNWQTICFMKDDERRKISKIKHWEKRLAEKGFPGRGNPKNKAVEVRNG